MRGSRATNITGRGVSHLRCSVKDVFAGGSATGDEKMGRIVRWRQPEMAVQDWPQLLRQHRKTG